MSAPIAKKDPLINEIHGVKLIDNYAWMRGKDWPNKINEEDILDYIKAENAYYDAYAKPHELLKEKLFEELKGRVKLTDQSTYAKEDDYYYYTRTEEDKDYPIYCRKYGSTNAPEEIILNVNEIAKDKKYTSVGEVSVSPDHKLMAYSTDFTGGERFTIQVYDLENKSFLSDEIPETIGDVIWHEKELGFFYTPTDENWRHDKVKYHKLGDDYKNDKIILHETDHLYSVNVGKSSSRKYIFISVGGHDNNEEYYFNMDDASFTPKLIQARQDKVLYSVDHGDGYFYMHTNANKCDNFKILRANDVDDISIANSWHEYIAEDKQRNLSAMDITEKFMLLNYKFNALPQLIVRNLQTGISKEIRFPDSAFTAGVFSTNYEENDIRVSYSSLSRPSSVYSYDFESEQLTTLKVQEIPSGHNPEEYHVERIHAKSVDGVMVPITLVYKKSLFKGDGSNPLYLYGYGSYGSSVSPYFRSTAISFANRGFVFALAHIRGGSDVDYNWYQAAKFLTKKRTFDDFIAVADHLVANKYTSSGNIAIMGGSAGGMLMGAVINQRPELFKAVIAHVPFVDVLNTMLDETLPLTPQEFKEWGNPKDEEYFHYMLSYSPYENVKAQNYPHIFVTAGLSDPRVGYWEAAKWVARLRAQKTDDNTLLLKTNMNFGHSGASGRFDYLKEIADDLVFILDKFNIKK